MKEETPVTFEYDQDTFSALHDGTHLTVWDCNGDKVFSVRSAVLPNGGTLRMFLDIFNMGYEDGREQGKFDMQYNFRKLLGL